MTVISPYPNYFDMSVKVAGCAAAGHAAWDKGECDLGYSALNIVHQYIMRTGRWAPEKAEAKRYLSGISAVAE